MRYSFNPIIVLIAFLATLLVPGNSLALLPQHLDAGCLGCHNLHGGIGSALLVEVDSESTCLSCHGPLGTATEVTIHDPNAYGAGNLGYITCLECHNPHNNDRLNVNLGSNIKLVGMEIDHNNDPIIDLVTPQIREETPTGFGSLKEVVFEVSPDDWNRPGDLYGVCNACHGATHNEGNDCSGCHMHDDSFKGAGCTGCHDGTGAGALAISDSSPHALDATGYTCEDCHGGHDAGTIEIPNNGPLGINYGSNGEAGISLGTATATGSTEAEICWNCHVGQSPIVSEWGANTGGTYNYGSLHSSFGDATASPGNHVDWTTGYWKSANFTYKNGPLGTRPVDGNADPGSNATGRGSASLHATGGTVGTPSNDMAEISCSYCHDVHDTFGPDGKPYLRGTWTRSAYPEDGAPQSGDSWTDASPFSAGDNVPRGLNTQNGLGGYQIDQNNAIDNTAYLYADDDGLCALCHTTNGSSTGFVGSFPLHRNIIPGFSNDAGTTARNIFWISQRSTSDSRTDPWMAYFGMTDFYDSRGWMAGLREMSAGNPARDIGIVPSVDGQAMAYDDFSWGVTVDDGTIDVDFHNFTCSKCHTPHASRLPRLMITNCLDVERNTWDDDFTGQSTWGNWPDLTPSSGSEGYREIAYANSAQNCHRYFPAQTGSGSGDYEGTGWNSVTPW